MSPTVKRFPAGPWLSWYCDELDHVDNLSAPSRQEISRRTGQVALHTTAARSSTTETVIPGLIYCNQHGVRCRIRLRTILGDEQGGVLRSRPRQLEGPACGSRR